VPEVTGGGNDQEHCRISVSDPRLETKMAASLTALRTSVSRTCREAPSSTLRRELRRERRNHVVRSTRSNRWTTGPAPSCSGAVGAIGPIEPRVLGSNPTPEDERF
jgi:hypothetical protein